MEKLALAVLVFVAFSFVQAKYHVVQTNLKEKDTPRKTIEEVREHTRKILKLKAQERDNSPSTTSPSQEDEGSGSVITDPTTMVVYFQNPSQDFEEIVVRDFLPQYSILQDFHVHNEGTTISSVEFDDKTEAEKAFLKACDEGRTAIIMGDLHPKASPSNIKWLSDEELRQNTKVELQDVSQVTGMILRVSPMDIFSVSFTFEETVTAGTNPGDVKDLYRTHLSFELGPRSKSIKGFVESPNYPEQYPDNADMKWLFHAPAEQNLGINFQLVELETEACCDHIHIYDGLTTNAPVLNMFSGSMEDNEVTSVTTNSPDMLVEFKSDCYRSSGMFSFNFASVQNALPATCSNSTTIIGDSGYFASPGYPDNYPQSADCVWIIQTGAGTWVSLVANNFEIAFDDTVTIFYFTQNNEDVLLGEYSGKEGANANLVAQNNTAYIRLISGIHEKLPGFAFSYSSVKPPTACDQGLIYTDFVEGVISSENYPESYNNNSTCAWLISLNEGSVVGANIKDFMTEDNFDNLFIFDGNNTEAPQLADISGGTGQDRVYFSSGKDMLFVFQSDNSISDRGFYIDWLSYSKTEQCQRLRPIELNDAQGYLNSPNYPNPFPAGTACQYLIKGTAGNALQLNLRSLRIGQRSNNSLLIFDGPTVNNRILFDSNYEIIREGNFVFSSTQNEVLIEFNGIETDESYRGFALLYNEIVLSNICADVVELGNEPQGIISSPLHPGFFPPSITLCAWHIQTALGTFVSVRRDGEFDIGFESSLDFYEGGDVDGVSLAGCRGRSCPERIHADGREMFIRFEIIGSHYGFQYTYFSSATSCPGSSQSVSNAEGLITSTNYPYEYNANETCGWEIITGRDNEIHYSIPVFDTEKDKDILIVYDNANDVLLKNLSGNTAVQNFVGGNRGYVQFTTDEQNEFRGFELYYEVVLPKNPIPINITCTSVDVLKSSSGVIFSQSFPGNYPPGLDYCWSFVSSNKPTNYDFAFELFDTEPVYDFVSVYNGGKLNGDSLVDTFSGLVGNIHSNVYNTTSTTVYFHTDNTNERNGFKLVWSHS